MSEVKNCPNQAIAEQTVTVLETLRDRLIPQINKVVEGAVRMNEAAIAEPLVTLGADISPQQASDVATTHLSNFDRINTAVTNATEVIDAPCPGREVCAKECLKRTVVMEATSIVHELADLTRPEYLQ